MQSLVMGIPHSRCDLQRHDDRDRVWQSVAVRPSRNPSMGKLMVCTVAAAVLFQPALMAHPGKKEALDSRPAAADHA